MASSVGLKLLSAMLDSGDVQEFSKVDLNPELLRPHETEVYEFIRDFVYKHKCLPKKKTVLHNIEDITLPQAEEVPSYYAEQVAERYISDRIKKGWANTKPFLEKGSMDVGRGVETLTETLMDIHRLRKKNKIVDFKDSKEFIATAYKKKKILGADGSIMMGYPSVDKDSGGMQGGDLISLVGRPAMGKTFHLLRIAHNAWLRQKKNVFVVSMEMPAIQIHQRLASMHTKHSLSQIKKAQLSTKSYKDLLLKLDTVGDHPASLWVADGGLRMSVEDIWKTSLELNPDFILIDGAYLLDNPNRRLGKYEKVAENTREMKAMLSMDLDIPVLASWQFSKNATKKLEKNKDAEAGLEDIGYSDEISQISSLVLGLIQTESVETIMTRKVKIMKGRDGEQGVFFVNWDFYNMDFSEVIKGEKKSEEEFEEELVID